LYIYSTYLKMSLKDDNKQKYGQFFTTNYKYILDGMIIPKNTKTIVEPFVGAGDLLNFVKKSKVNLKVVKLKCYDIDPPEEHSKLIKKIETRDTLKNPPSYKDSFILTNPPYLARNKSKDKSLFDQYHTNDLYKCFLINLINNRCQGGIVIIPLNFWSSIRMADCHLRRDFLRVYSIIRINVFEERVFQDTSYTVCSFQFQVGPHKGPIQAHIYPSKTEISFSLNEKNNYTIGGSIYNLKNRLKKRYTVSRLTSKNIKQKNTNILVKCIDDSLKKQLGLSIVSDKKIYVDKTPKSSARTYATLIITPSISITKQRELVDHFNTYMSQMRQKYNSLFLTNYRESKDISRKRISFDLVYVIVQFILENVLE
jgi:hypothetical protein